MWWLYFSGSFAGLFFLMLALSSGNGGRWRDRIGMALCGAGIGALVSTGGLALVLVLTAIFGGGR